MHSSLNLLPVLRMSWHMTWARSGFVCKVQENIRESYLQPAGRRNAPVALSFCEVILIGDRFLRGEMIKAVICVAVDWLINPDYVRFLLKIIYDSVASLRRGH